MSRRAVAALLAELHGDTLAAPKMQASLVRGKLRDAGRAHAACGGMLTPHDCQIVDAQIMRAARLGARPFVFYADMRGAFNQGWTEERARIDSTPFFGFSNGDTQ